ncbi:MAG: serine hydrolase [Oligoflexales bacterium]|nr:serine hydrolase [Oligoflexales bacterium]
MRFRNLKKIVISTICLWLFAYPHESVAAKRSRATPAVTRDGKPNIKSAVALIADLNTGEILYEKDADVVRPIASISKMFAALAFLDECNLDPEELHEMTNANRDAAKGGDKTRLTTGWSFSHRDLLHAALMRSDNRAFPALAEACGFNPSAIAEKMTAKARKLGLVKTSFKEPNGLSPENVSTAREIMIALREAIKIPIITEIMTKSEYTMTAYKDDRSRQIKIKNSDRLLSKNIAQILGGKTGYTDLARYCFAVAARIPEGRDIGMVFLGAEGKHTRFADFTRVIKWISLQYQDRIDTGPIASEKQQKQPVKMAKKSKSTKKQKQAAKPETQQDSLASKKDNKSATETGEEKTESSKSGAAAEKSEEQGTKPEKPAQIAAPPEKPDSKANTEATGAKPPDQTSQKDAKPSAGGEQAVQSVKTDSKTEPAVQSVKTDSKTEPAVQPVTPAPPAGKTGKDESKETSAAKPDAQVKPEPSAPKPEQSKEDSSIKPETKPPTETEKPK